VNEAIRQQACLTREKGTAMANIILSSLQNMQQCCQAQQPTQNSQQKHFLEVYF